MRSNSEGVVTCSNTADHVGTHAAAAHRLLQNFPLFIGIPRSFLVFVVR